MLLADVVATTEAVAATRSRLAKVDALATLFLRLDPDEILPTVGLLTASVRQGRLGVGWRSLMSLDIAHAKSETLTISEVDEAFSSLAAFSGQGSARERRESLARLAARASGPEWDFLVRVITGELRSGALEGVLLDAITRASGKDSVAVRRAAMLSGDLGHAAVLALTGAPGELEAVGLQVGRAVMPMLASTAATVADAIAEMGSASIEYKLDGARIQVHRNGAEVRVFTRSLADVTHRVPEIVQDVLSLPADTLILDGETLSLDDDGAPRPFQDTMARFGTAMAHEVLLHPWFFDVLHVNGRDLLDEPWTHRRHELERIAPGRVVPSLATANVADAQAFANRALAAGHEGVMVKAVDAPYIAGRRGKTWMKVKPVHTLDLVVLGVEFGSGRRNGWLSNLHLGAFDPEGMVGAPGSFVMVGKTFKGLTDQLLRWQTDYFPTIETHRTGSTVFVEPTTVVEIAIDGVQRSTRYPGGVALRFARVKNYRSDKRAVDADTIGHLKSMLRGG